MLYLELHKAWKAQFAVEVTYQAPERVMKFQLGVVASTLHDIVRRVIKNTVYVEWPILSMLGTDCVERGTASLTIS